MDFVRVVYSFSIPDNSVAHWQLKKWKAEGQNISDLVRKLVEGEGSQILHLEKELASQVRIIKRQNAILRCLGTNQADWQLRTRPDGAWHVHAGAITEAHAKHIIERAEGILKFNTHMDYSGGEE